MRDWVHEFAASVIRPAGAEWDEREETPWPILRGGGQDRAVLARLLRDPVLRGVGARHPDGGRGAVLGRRRDRAVAGRHHAGRGRGGGQRDAGADRRVVPADVRRRRATSSSARSAPREPDAGSDVGAIRTRAVYDEAHDEWVHQRGQDLGHQRRHRERARGRRLGRPGPRLARAGELHRPAGHQAACPRGRSSASTASAPRTPPRWCWTTSGCPAAAWSAARRSSRSGWPGSARAAAAASRRR